MILCSLQLLNWTKNILPKLPLIFEAVAYLRESESFNKYKWVICDFDPYHEDETILKILAQINQFIYMVKGQIISEAIFLVLNSSKKQNLGRSFSFVLEESKTRKKNLLILSDFHLLDFFNNNFPGKNIALNYSIHLESRKKIARNHTIKVFTIYILRKRSKHCNFWIF